MGRHPKIKAFDTFHRQAKIDGFFTPPKPSLLAPRKAEDSEQSFQPLKRKKEFSNSPIDRTCPKTRPSETRNFSASIEIHEFSEDELLNRYRLDSPKASLPPTNRDNKMCKYVPTPNQNTNASLSVARYALSDSRSDLPKGKIIGSYSTRMRRLSPLLESPWSRPQRRALRIPMQPRPSICPL